MAAKLTIEIECLGDVFLNHLGAFSPEPELVSVLMAFCTGALTNGLQNYKGRNIPLTDTKGRPVGRARFIEGK
jgi:hypothetical protein